MQPENLKFLINSKVVPMLPAQRLGVARASPVGLDITGFRFKLCFFLAGGSWASRWCALQFFDMKNVEQNS